MIEINEVNNKPLNNGLMTGHNDLLKKYSAPVPRYTSYPTSPQFHDGVDSSTYANWLSAIPEEDAVSIYIHIPFCDTLCWFCGCHTKITRRYEPVTKYLSYLFREIEMVGKLLQRKNGGNKQPVKHIHWGGGSPTILEPADILALGNHIAEHFKIQSNTEFAVEIDP
ncbi:MAG: hypothetical protein R3261_00085, partial [Alphaproteobacteria bacterium]|nr:hypothetical protein [Alphaproteobacteria bacterium]